MLRSPVVSASSCDYQSSIFSSAPQTHSQRSTSSMLAAAAFTGAIPVHGCLTPNIAAVVYCGSLIEAAQTTTPHASALSARPPPKRTDAAAAWIFLRPCHSLTLLSARVSSELAQGAVVDKAAPAAAPVHARNLAVAATVSSPPGSIFRSPPVPCHVHIGSTHADGPQYTPPLQLGPVYRACTLSFRVL